MPTLMNTGPGIVVSGVGCYIGVLCKTIMLMAKSPTAVVTEYTNELTKENHRCTQITRKFFTHLHNFSSSKVNHE